jgi:hypothetical protein
MNFAKSQNTLRGTSYIDSMYNNKVSPIVAEEKSRASFSDNNNSAHVASEQRASYPNLNSFINKPKHVAAPLPPVRPALAPILAAARAKASTLQKSKAPTTTKKKKEEDSIPSVSEDNEGNESFVVEDEEDEDDKDRIVFKPSFFSTTKAKKRASRKSSKIAAKKKKQLVHSSFSNPDREDEDEFSDDDGEGDGADNENDGYDSDKDRFKGKTFAYTKDEYVEPPSFSQESLEEKVSSSDDDSDDDVHPNALKASSSSSDDVVDDSASSDADDDPMDIDHEPLTKSKKKAVESNDLIEGNIRVITLPHNPSAKPPKPRTTSVSQKAIPDFPLPLSIAPRNVDSSESTFEGAEKPTNANSSSSDDGALDSTTNIRECAKKLFQDANLDNAILYPDIDVEQYVACMTTLQQIQLNACVEQQTAKNIQFSINKGHSRVTGSSASFKQTENVQAALLFLDTVAHRKVILQRLNEANK